jgi:ABC-2 type transport system ATP-binding protein
MIKCINLEKTYENKNVLNRLSFEVRQGEIFGLLGPNGAGKTTTIKMILGLATLDAGQVIKDDHLKIGYQPETPYFHGYLTAYEVLAFYAKIQKLSKNGFEEHIKLCLKKVGLENDMKRKVQKFSKGMVQRLAVAQALLGDPDVLIFDEPSAGLDVLGRIEMKKLILKLKREGKTILLNSHILNDVETVADRVCMIKDGHVVKEVDLRCDEQAMSLESIFIKAMGGKNNVNDSI